MISPHIALAVILDDLVKLIVYRRKNGQTKEADMLQLTHESLQGLVQALDDEIHVLKLEKLSERIKAKMLEQELKTVYNELYKRDQKFATDMITRSYMPTKRQISEDIIIKNPEAPAL